MCKRLKVGTIYHGFDDGKINLTRLIDWKIIKEIDLTKGTIDINLLEMLKSEVSTYHWIFNKDQDVIYKAQAISTNGRYNNEIGQCYFLKSLDGWFGTGYYGSRLDEDGSLYKLALDSCLD